MTRRLLLAVAAAALLVPCVALAAPQATLAEARIGGASIEFAPQVDFSRAVLTVSTPGGQVLRFEGSGTVPSFGLYDAKGHPHADGAYQWELRLSPRMTPELRKQLRAARARGEEGTRGDERVVSGSFAIAGGAFVSPDEREAQVRSSVEKALTPTTAADQVIPDDLIVQGSACVGIDCVNNENFGFDTIRMKENNTRIDFTDTSTSAGFPTQDWEIAANDSASGGRNALIVSDETTQLFVIESGNVANALYVDDLARVGMKTSNPVLDLHIATSNTPGIRLEQTNAGGFTAQTWDIAGNEANFFVRDVTGGSLLPFRIRPGAPTSSLDISADGDVGIGTASPDARLEVVTNAAAVATVRYTNTNASGFAGGEYFEDATQGLFVGLDNANNLARINAVNNFPLVILTNSTERIRFPAPGGNFITATNGAVLNSIGQWVDGSSRELKQNIAELSPTEAMAALAGLTPVTFAYKAAPSEVQAGFIAEDVPDLVAQRDRKGLSSLEIVAVLTKVVQQQLGVAEEKQAQIEQLQSRLATLEAMVAALAKVQ